MTDADRPTWRERLTQLCVDPGLAAELYPPERADDLWSPGEQDLELAWAIYTELRTRIATQGLPIRDGVESIALKSLVDLFALARGAMANRRQALHATSLLVHCLNHHIRPFTAAWHAKSEAGELSSLDQRFRFRAELTGVQRVLRALASVFGQIVGDKDAMELLAPLPTRQANEDTARGQLPYGICIPGQYPAQVAALNAAELRLINGRRGVPAGNLDEPVHDAVGLAISGGGIRSATFALGVVEVLARRGILRAVDVMSTVSGGGYLGSFITSVLSVDDDKVGLRPDQQPFAAKGHVESQSIRYLRNHSKYLSEGGVATLALMVFSSAYGIAMSLVLVAPALLLLAILAVYGFGLGLGIEPDGWVNLRIPPEASRLLSRAVWVVLALVVIVLSVLRNPSGRVRETVERTAIVLSFAGLAIWLTQWIPGLYGFAQGRTLELLVGALMLPLVLGALGLWYGVTTICGRVAWSLLVAFGPLFFLSMWLLSVELVVGMRGWSRLLPWGVTTVVLVHAWIGVNINFASLHLYYRSRLARTYLRRVGVAGAVDPQLLSGVNQWNKAPLHLINAAVNLPASRNPELRGRNTDFFTFAQHFCGGPSVGWWPTKEWEAKDRHLDLGTAMAISGAAAAPRMGTLTSAKYTALLAMLNVRLGYWLRKPGTSGLLNSVPGGLYFLRELTGQMHEGLSFLNVSDGGHIENLGLYELLRRRCRYIVAIDGEADPDHAFGGLLTAIQMAKIDLGVRIEPDLTDLRDGVEHFKRAHFVMTRIDYGEVDGGEPVHGLLLVIKLALTGNESELLMRYRREYPSFPHQSTAQQLFSESQFEAYRALGEHAADAAFDPLLVGDAPSTAMDWLRELEQRLLRAA